MNKKNGTYEWIRECEEGIEKCASEISFCNATMIQNFSTKNGIKSRKAAKKAKKITYYRL